MVLKAVFEVLPISPGLSEDKENRANATRGLSSGVQFSEFEYSSFNLQACVELINVSLRYFCQLEGMVL